MRVNIICNLHRFCFASVKGLCLSRLLPAVTESENMRRSQYLIFIALLYLFRIIPAHVSAASPAGQNTVRVHYHRTNGDYAGWSIYSFTGALHPTAIFSKPDPPTGTDDFGIYFDVPLLPNATEFQFIIVDANGPTKNCQNDLTQTISAGLE